MITRRDFLKSLIAFFTTTFVSWFVPEHSLQTVCASAGKPTLSVVTGTHKKALLKHALDAFGGMQQWVHPGSTVVIKPNAAFSREPEKAVTVHPELLIHVINQCYEAGARKVSVIEHPCDNYKSAFKISGIKKAVASTKATLRALGKDKDFVSIDVPQGKSLTRVAIAKEIQKADVFINMPIAKVHSSATLTLGMKNHMGAIHDRGYFHTNDLHQCIADVSTVLQPDLIIVDATRILLTNGPKGPGEVQNVNKIIVGTDQVAVDSYAATLFGYRGSDIGHIQSAYELGLGEIDLSNVDIRIATV